MEKVTFDILCYTPLPGSTTLEIGPDGIRYGSKHIDWNTIETFCHYKLHENLGTMYFTTICLVDGQNHIINFRLNDFSGSDKKTLYQKAYEAIFLGIREYVVYPGVEAHVKNLNKGLNVQLANRELSRDGIEIRTGLFKKKSTRIPFPEVLIERMQNSGGFRVHSTQNGASDFFSYEARETRMLLALLERLCPEQAGVYY